MTRWTATTLTSEVNPIQNVLNGSNFTDNLKCYVEMDVGHLQHIALPLKLSDIFFVETLPLPVHTNTVFYIHLMKHYTDSNETLRK